MSPRILEVPSLDAFRESLVERFDEVAIFGTPPPAREQAAEARRGAQLQ